MAEPMEVENGHAAADKGKAPMLNGTAAKPSRGYELPWVSGSRLPQMGQMGCEMRPRAPL